VTFESFGKLYGGYLGTLLGEEIHDLCVYTIFLEYSQTGTIRGWI
jgi:hypothetical protein